MNSDTLADLIVTTLKAQDAGGDYATLAGDNVFAPRDWPTTKQVMPILMVQPQHEVKESIGKATPQYSVSITVRVIGRLNAKAEGGDAAANALRLALGTFQRQIERAVVNSYDLTKQIEQIASIVVEKEVTAEGREYFGEVTIDFELQTYQGPEDFAQPAISALEEVAIFADLINVYDPTGTYANPPFPEAVTAAPRTEGPDGRSEGAALIELPQN